MTEYPEAKLMIEMRERTALPYLTCRRLLQEADGDIEKAIQLAREETRKRNPSPFI